MQTKIEETVASLKKELSAFKGVKDGEAARYDQELGGWHPAIASTIHK